MKLDSKVIIKGKIITITGLHIGGSKSALDIGGIDNNVIKDALGRPYIPGSSLKGKIRALLELANYKENLKHTDDGIFLEGIIAKVFGVGASDKKDENNKDNNIGPTRFYARDAYLNEDIAYKMLNKEEPFLDLELDYTEGKWENIINRFTSKAEHPRQIERVPAGAKFDFEFVVNLFDEDKKEKKEILYLIRKGMSLLEDDYLGGNGTRGYGKIEFKDVKYLYKTMQDYKEDKNGESFDNLDDLIAKLVEKERD